MPDRCINMDKLLRALHHIDAGRFDNNQIAAKLELVPTSWYRMRKQASDLFGIEIEKSREIGVLYVKSWGMFNPTYTLWIAQRLVKGAK